MSNEKRYDPEDIEQLILNKSFSELLPEEKAFVLQYIESDLEYDSLRESYQLFGTLPSMEASVEPKAETKERLMAAFSEKAKAAPVFEKIKLRKEDFGLRFGILKNL